MKLLSKLLLAFSITLLISCNKNDSNKMAFITTAYNIDWPENNLMSENNLKESLQRIILDLKANEVRTIIFQVRPHAGTFYKSKYEPQSTFLTDSTIQVDILDYLVKLCKKENLKLYAWINPFRISVGEQDFYLAKQFIDKHPDWLIINKNKYFLNPGIPAARQYVVNIVREIIDNYKVDAVLFDDYFYPNDFQIKDYETYLKYSHTYKNIEEWRRANVTNLIKACHYRCKEKGIKFVVSPVGIWRNRENDKDGTNTKGLSAFDDLYSDTKLWCDSGYVDMIIPQLYLKIGQKSADFEELANWWKNNKGKVEYGIALAPFKIYENKWDSEEIDAQIFFLTSVLKCKNIAFYNTNTYLKYLETTDISF